MPAIKSFTIRKREFPKLKGPRWEVDCGIIGEKRVRKFFRSREEANLFASETKNVLRRDGERTGIQDTEGPTAPAVSPGFLRHPQADEVHVVFNNNARDFAPRAAERLRRQLGQLPEAGGKLKQAEML